MKKIAIFLFTFIPTMVLAQNFPGMGKMPSMDQGQMNNMMQQMQKMQSCMQNIDQSEIKKLEQRSKQIEAKVQTLCSKGKRAQAQKEAMSAGMEIANNPAVQAMAKCGKMMEGIMPAPESPFMNQDTDYSSQHICDE